MIPSCSLLAASNVTVTISLSSRSVSKKATNSTATATYNVANDGGVYINGGVSAAENWISDPTKVGNYDIRATLVSGNTPGGSALGTWISGATGASWNLTNSAKDNSVLSCVLTVEIREHVSGTVDASASITISAESDSLA